MKPYFQPYRAFRELSSSAIKLSLNWHDTDWETAPRRDEGILIGWFNLGYLPIKMPQKIRHKHLLLQQSKATMRYLYLSRPAFRKSLPIQAVLLLDISFPFSTFPTFQG